MLKLSNFWALWARERRARQQPPPNPPPLHHRRIARTGDLIHCLVSSTLVADLDGGLKPAVAGVALESIFFFRGKYGNDNADDRP